MTHQGILSLAFMLVSVGVPAMAAAQHASDTGGAMAIPSALKLEHEKLHADLAEATKLPGKTGVAAQKVATALHEHFLREEEFAMPPLGLLASLADGHVTPEMRPAIAMSDRLKAEMPQMLNEHKVIVQALEELGQAAQAEHHPEVSRFVEELTHHAENEEQVLYPAAILVGEYLKLKLPAR